VIRHWVREGRRLALASVPPGSFYSKYSYRRCRQRSQLSRQSLARFLAEVRLERRADFTLIIPRKKAAASIPPWPSDGRLSNPVRV
jgi:hypothetical protein